MKCILNKLPTRKVLLTPDEIREDQIAYGREKGVLFKPDTNERLSVEGHALAQNEFALSQLTPFEKRLMFPKNHLSAKPKYNYARGYSPDSA